jgi:hypothetical protein
VTSGETSFLPEAACEAYGVRRFAAATGTHAGGQAGAVPSGNALAILPIRGTCSPGPPDHLAPAGTSGAAAVQSRP